MLEVLDCEECGKDIGPDDAFVAIDLAAAAPDVDVRAVRLHLDCIGKFRLKHPSIDIPGMKKGTTSRKREK
jgi:hypothetical protein